jgi:hypothetical protein
LGTEKFNLWAKTIVKILASEKERHNRLFRVALIPEKEDGFKVLK